MNMTIGICLKIGPSGLEQKCISADSSQLLELLPLRASKIDLLFSETL